MSSKMLHTCLRVENLEKSIAFTKMLLVLKKNVGKIFQTTSSRLFIWPCLGDDYELELTYNYDHGPYVIGDGYAHVALSTPGSRRFECGTQGKGYEVTEPKGLPGTQPNYYFVVDPDGYKVEVIRENKRTKTRAAVGYDELPSLFMKPFTKKECFFERNLL